MGGCRSARKNYQDSRKPPRQIAPTVLTGVTHVPVIRKDGSISVEPGYDAVTGLYLDPRGTRFPKVEEFPTKQEAGKALALLRDLLTELPFVGEADRAVAVSAMLTIVSRRSLRAAPMHAFTSPVMGSGKSLLVDIVSIIGAGREASVIAQGSKPEETEKRLGAILRYGDPLISLDNCEQPVGGEFLCQLLTQPIVRARILGLSEAPEMSTNTMVFCTGNNLTVSGDMSHRMILCSLDPKEERPEKREFKRNPIDIIKANRGHYVHAALTILRAYRQATDMKRPKPLGSFNDWSDTVRGALLWLGMVDPVDTMELVRESDTKLEELTTVLTHWEEVIRSERMSVAQVIKTANKRETSNFVGSEYKNEGFRDALLTVAGAGGDISPKRLGKWLSANKERIVDGRLISRNAVFSKVAHWKLIRRQSREA
jgi:putative DNA primase/helicase